MARLLYLVHRLPFPPNKGDKVRSYHLLRHLARAHAVHLGTFIDDPDDWRYLEAVKALCADVHVASLDPRRAKLKSLVGLATGEALTLPYYRDRGLQAWVDRTLARGDIDAVVVFSSAMAQYLPADDRHPMLVDFVDVDSAKWTQYAPAHRWPMSWIYRREGERLLAFERTVTQRALQSFFVTDQEAEMFRARAPESAAKVHAVMNGVDAAYFDPAQGGDSPYPGGRPSLVFTGAMDYWPNIDAVTWFVQDILPKVEARHPGVHLHIVGRAPTPAVSALAGAQVTVTGTVPDVRPYLRHADVVVAPLRVARGVQNKILEAMAMARPVVAAASCVEAIDAQPGREIEAADTPEAYADKIANLLAQPETRHAMGRSARDFVLARYSWDAHLARLDAFLPAGGRDGG